MRPKLLTRDASQVVLFSVLEDCNQAVAPKLPKVQSKKRTIRYIRQQTLAGSALPLTSSEMAFPRELTKTFKGDQFLIYDSGRIEKRIVIFATRRNLERLSKSRQWYANGTFKTVLLLFHQLYTVHRLRKNDSLPLVFGLLPDKTEETYTKFLQEIKNIEPSCAPLSIRIDFERAMMNACLKEVLNIEINGCFFHFSQCIFRVIQANVLTQEVLTGGTCTPWRYKVPKQGVRHEASEYWLFQTICKNLFSMLIEIRKHFPKPFLTSAFRNDFLS